MTNPITYKTPWEVRRPALLDDLCRLIYDLDRGQIAHVGTNINYIYVHFYRGNREIGDLGLGTALHALVEDVYLWPECGKMPRGKQREEDRPDLDIRDADLVTLQSH